MYLQLHNAFFVGLKSLFRARCNSNGIVVSLCLRRQSLLPLSLWLRHPLSLEAALQV
jgi:hypothetical protein